MTKNAGEPLWLRAQPNCGFTADVNVSHFFGIFTTMPASSARRAPARLTKALGLHEDSRI
jgi:hypothetical protein